MSWITSPQFRKHVFTVLRWCVAVIGLAYVLSQISLHDRVLVLDPQTGRPVQTALAQPAHENDARFLITDPRTGAVEPVSRDQLLRRADAKTLTLRHPLNGAAKVNLLAVADSPRGPATRLLVADPHTGRGVWITPADVAGGYTPQVIFPLVDLGISQMVSDAQPGLLLLSFLVYPAALILTSIRWQQLLEGLRIRLTFVRTLALTLVGAFYNNFLPGSVGGDVFKAYYASQHTTRRTCAVMSVLVDRFMGMIVLIIIGGAMAAWQYSALPAHHDSLAAVCRWVAIASAAMVASTILVALVLYVPALRKAARLDRLLAMLPARKQTANALQAMEDYGRQPGLMAGMLLISVPVHIVVVLSAMFAGEALQLPLSSTYYFIAVPVIVLAGVLPLAPQGAGVMEFVAVQLAAAQGASVAQALWLTLAIRLVPVLWSMGGGILVATGRYAAPSAAGEPDAAAAQDASVQPATEPPLLQ